MRLRPAGGAPVGPAARPPRSDGPCCGRRGSAAGGAALRGVRSAPRPHAHPETPGRTLAGQRRPRGGHRRRHRTSAIPRPRRGGRGPRHHAHHHAQAKSRTAPLLDRQDRFLEDQDPLPQRPSLPDRHPRPEHSGPLQRRVPGGATPRDRRGPPYPPHHAAGRGSSPVHPGRCDPPDALVGRGDRESAGHRAVGRRPTDRHESLRPDRPPRHRRHAGARHRQ